jgi:hypothetical protein
MYAERAKRLEREVYGPGSASPSAEGGASHKAADDKQVVYALDASRRLDGQSKSS